MTRWATSGCEWLQQTVRLFDYLITAIWDAAVITRSGVRTRHPLVIPNRLAVAKADACF